MPRLNVIFYYVCIFWIEISQLLPAFTPAPYFKCYSINLKVGYR